MHASAADDNTRLTAAEAGFLAMIGIIGAVEVGATVWLALRTLAGL